MHICFLKKKATLLNFNVHNRKKKFKFKEVHMVKFIKLLCCRRRKRRRRRRRRRGRRRCPCPCTASRVEAYLFSQVHQCLVPFLHASSFWFFSSFWIFSSFFFPVCHSHYYHCYWCFFSSFFSSVFHPYYYHCY